MQSSLPPAPGTGRAIRVLHCIPTLGIGGAETQLRLLAPRLAARGAKVAIIGRITELDEAVFAHAGVTCFRLQSGRNYDPAIAAAMIGAFRRFRPTVVQTWLTQMDILGGLTAIGYGVPWLIAERSSPPAYPPGFKNRLRSWLGRRATVVANAPQGRDVWPDHAVEVIGNGIDLAAVAAMAASPVEDRAPFAGRVTIATVSRLVPNKNIDVLIAAVALARAAIPAIRLVVVGEGPERPRLEALVADRRLGDHVVFAGMRETPIALIRSADMFASASLFEGHPNAVTEAVAAGMPTVLSDIAPHRSLLGDAALYAPADDPAGFAAHMVALARNAQQREAIVAAGRTAVARFDIDAIAAQYLALYERLSPAS